MKYVKSNSIEKNLIENLEFRNMKFPKEFEILVGFRDNTSKKHFKMVQEYKTYARYMDIRTGLFECFNKIDFKDNINITVLDY